MRFLFPFVAYGEPRDMLEVAKPYLVTPVQKKMVVRARDVRENVLNAGETALSEYSLVFPMFL